MAYVLSCDRCGQMLEKGQGRPSWIPQRRTHCPGCQVVAKELEIRQREILDDETMKAWNRAKERMKEIDGETAET